MLFCIISVIFVFCVSGFIWLLVIVIKCVLCCVVCCVICMVLFVYGMNEIVIIMLFLCIDWIWLRCMLLSVLNSLMCLFVCCNV